MQLFRTVLGALAVLPAIASPVPEAPKAGDIIQDAYIVVLKKDVSAQAIEEHKSWATSIHSEALKKRGDALPTKTFTYEYDLETIKGYAGIFDKSTIDEIAARDEVAFVEPDTVVTTAGLEGRDARYSSNASSNLTTQSPIGSWGLGAISHRSGTGSNYTFDTSAGAGVYAYVIDSGIFVNHSDFGGRAIWGANFIDTSQTDGRNRGTHLAGTIGSTTYGVAKNVNLIAVKAINNSGHGTLSSFVASIYWVVNDVKTKGRKTKSVAMIGVAADGNYTLLNNAVTMAFNAGITVVVAAGRPDANATGLSPLSAAGALTVGATNSNLTRAPYSNFGAKLDIFAPGTGIKSTHNGNRNAIAIMSDTSVAAAHVAGVAAYLIAKENLTSPGAVKNRILELATSGLVKDAGPNCSNKFLYNGSGE